MLGHMGCDAVGVLQEANMAQLVELVVADGLNAHALLDLGNVLGAGGHSGNAGAGEGYLGSGGELEVAVGVAGLYAGSGDVEQLVLLSRIVIKMMHGVGVVPEDAEVFCGALHGSQAAHNLVGIGNATGVGVLGNAPDALEGGIVGHQLFNGIHVGAIFGHGDGYHLDAEGLGHAEVAVVAGDGAHELDLLQLAPRSGTQGAEHPAAHNGVVHDVQAGVAEHDGVVGGIVEHGGHQLFGLGQAVDHAVVADVGAGSGLAIVGGRQDVQHGHAEVKLVGARLAARHVQGKPLRLERLVFLGQCGLERGELFFSHFRVSGHRASFRCLKARRCAPFV